MSGDGTDRNGAGEPDESADGTDWLLSQLDEDETGAIETQPDAAVPESSVTASSVTEPVAPQPPTPTPAPGAPDDDRTRVLPVVQEPTTDAARAERTDAPPTPSPAADVAQGPAASAPTTPPPATMPTTDAAAPTAPGEFASEAELLTWWQSHVSAEAATGASGAVPEPEATEPEATQSETPEFEATRSSAAAAADEPVAAGPDAPTPMPTEPRLHPSALQLPVVPPTPAPEAPVPPVLNELTVDTDSVLQHAPAGTFRPAPTNPVVLPPVDDQPWSLGTDEDTDRPAPEDVETAALPIARALAADDPAAWAEVEAETTDAPAVVPVTPEANSVASAEPSLAASAPPATVMPDVIATPGTAAPPDATGTTAEAADVHGTVDDATADGADLPRESWSLSETFGDDVLDGAIVEVRDDTTEVPAEAESVADAPASEPRTDPLAWLTEPFGDTFGATTDDVTDAASAPTPGATGVVPVEPQDEAVSVDTAPADQAVADVPEDSEPGPTVTESADQPEIIDAADAIGTVEPAPGTAPVTPVVASPTSAEPTTAPSALRWDSPAPSTPATPAEPVSPADVPWPEPADSSEPLDETRPFDSLGGPGLIPAAGAAPAAPEPPAAAAAFVAPVAVPTTPIDDATAAPDAAVPPAFGPPTPPAERSITELISLDGVQLEPSVSPFGGAPFVWDLAPNDALDPLVHAAPTTQPIAVPPVQWEAAAPGGAVSEDSPSELALEGEVPDAAFIAGDIQPFAPGLAAETLGRPLLDGPGDEFGSWTDDDVDQPPTPTVETPIIPAANDTVDLFPTLSLGGLDAGVDATALAAGVAAGGIGAGLAGGAANTDDASTADVEAPASDAELPSYAVDPEELDDEFDEEIVEFDAIPLSASGAAPLQSFVPDDALPDNAAAILDPISPIDAVDAPSADEEPVEAFEAHEAEPVSEELRLESLFDVGPDTDLVDVVPSAETTGDSQALDEATIDAPATIEVPQTTGEFVQDSTTDDIAAAPQDAPIEPAEGAAATSLADAFAAEGGWSLQADAADEPGLPLVPVPGLVAGDGSDVSAATPESAPEADVTPAVAPEDEVGGDRVEPHDLVEPIAPASTLAFGSILGAGAVAVPTQGPVVPAVQTAPAALTGETVAFPELDAAGALGGASPAAGVVGASLPPQTVQSTPERDLPEYHGDAVDHSIPKALLWTVVGLGAAVLLLLAFYFGTLVGAANTAAAESVSTPSAASSVPPADRGPDPA
ncbi:hypothetical protein [Plantibacter sp. RU18]|uniref:hypothetical protein n=1 Tax=Plantibacter sp. RU18 TaxID=3158143 RepID=UPI003D35B403